MTLTRIKPGGNAVILKADTRSRGSTATRAVPERWNPKPMRGFSILSLSGSERLREWRVLDARTVKTRARVLQTHAMVTRTRGRVAQTACEIGRYRCETLTDATALGQNASAWSQYACAGSQHAGALLQYSCGLRQDGCALSRDASAPGLPACRSNRDAHVRVHDAWTLRRNASRRGLERSRIAPGNECGETWSGINTELIKPRWWEGVTPQASVPVSCSVFHDCSRAHSAGS